MSDRDIPNRPWVPEWIQTGAWVTEVDGLLREKRALEEELRMNGANILLRTNQLQDFLRAGGTTGDVVRDLVLRAHGYAPGFEANYRTFGKSLAGKKGEFALVIYEGQRVVGHDFGKGAMYAEAIFYRLGVLQSEELVLLGTESISLPIPRYIGGEVTFIPSEPDIESQLSQRYLRPHPMNILAQADSFDTPPSLLKLAEYVPIHGRMSSGLWVGDEAVRAQLENCGMPGLFEPAAAALGRLILTPTE